MRGHGTVGAKWGKMPGMRMILLLLFLLLSGGCAQLKGVRSAPAANAASYTPQTMYQVMVVELLAQRNDHAAAFKLLRPLVERTRDARLAQWLFQLSMQTYQVAAIEQASRLWHEIEPYNPTPLRALWLLKLRQGDVKSALSLFDRYQNITPEPLRQDLKLAAERVSGAIEAKTALAFAEALRKRYDTWAASWAAGLILLDKERPEKAMASFQAALDQGADKAVVYPAMARAWLALGRAQEGLDYLKDYVDAHPEDWRTQAEYARLEVEAGDFAAAEKRFRRVLDRQPDADVARLALGLLQFEQDKLDAAKAQFERLVRNPVTAQVAVYYLGRIHEQQGRLMDAVRRYAQVRSPRYRLDAQLRVVRIVYQLKGLASALKLLSRLSTDSATEQARLLLMRVALLAEAGERDRALAEAEKLLTAEGADRDVLMELAGVLYDMRADDLYERVMRRVLALAPDDADALNALGYFYVERNRNLDEAARMLFRAIERKPRAFYIEDSIGWLYWRKGELDRAAEWLRRALARQADSEVLAHLLQVEAARGRWQAVRALRERYRDLFDKDAKLKALWRKIEPEMRRAGTAASEAE